MKIAKSPTLTPPPGLKNCQPTESNIRQLCRFLRFYLAFHYYSAKYLSKNLLRSSKVWPHDDCWDLYHELLHWTRTRIHPVSETLPPLSGQNTLFLCNHRSAADFFMDGYLTEGAGYLGLLKSFFYFPLSCTLGYRCKSLVLFRKGGTQSERERAELYEKAYRLLRQKSLIIYPEGSRNIKQTSLPLKKGFLKFAYKRKVPVQIIICSDKETIFSAKTLSAQYGTVCRMTRSQVLEPSEYKDLESWIKAIEETWNEKWNEVYC